MGCHHEEEYRGWEYLGLSAHKLRPSEQASLMEQVKLLLFDEVLPCYIENTQALFEMLKLNQVHLLHEDRGPVIEILVARTLRKV